MHLSDDNSAYTDVITGGVLTSAIGLTCDNTPLEKFDITPAMNTRYVKVILIDHYAATGGIQYIHVDSNALWEAEKKLQ